MKIETAFYSGLIIGAYLLSGCGPEDSGIPPPTLTATPQEKKVKSEEENTLWEATVEGFTVKVIDERKTKTPLEEYPDAQKIVTALVREIPNPKEKMKQRMTELRKWGEGWQAQWMEKCRQEKEDETLTIALIDIITDELGGKFGATVACPNRLEINPTIAAREGFDRVQSHELAHFWQILLNGWGQTTEEEAEQNTYRFRGLTTAASTSAQSPVPAPSSSCFVYRSRYGETTKEILKIYQSRNSVELVVKEMRYKNQPNTAGPTTRLGEGWEITICPK